MMSEKYITVLFLVLGSGLGSGSCGKVLVWPADNSHWLNVKSILEELADRGHEVTVLLSSSFLGTDPTRSSPFNFEVIPVPFTKEDMASLMEDFLQMWVYELPNFSYWETTSRMCNLISRLVSINKATCDSVVWNEELMKMLREAAFDILLADPLVLGGELVAEKLGVPFVYTFRFSIGNTVERLCGGLPAPPSYVPASMGGQTDRMSFMERMKNMLFYALQDVLFHQFFWREWSQYYSDVLVWPTDASHWLNVKLVLEELSLRGHDVTVLVPSANLLIDYNESSSPFDFEVLPVPYTRETIVALMEDFLHLWLYELPHLSYWEGLRKMVESMAVFIKIFKQTCDSVVRNPRLIAKLRQAGFDVLISDPLSPGGELVAELLEIPFVYTFRFSEGNTMERLCGGLPAPPSYVPASTGGLTDRMSFTEKITNLLLYIYHDVFFLHFLVDEWNQYYSDVLGRPTTLCETMGKAEMWLIRTYWDFEFPRPFLPNFEFVGGLHCKPAKPLPEEMEEFVQSSGEHGIVVFSLGSMVYNLTEEKSNMVALALSQIPQKVLWRYKGKKPETLGPNTRIYDWIPQNDLLGHPKTKAFITHGGTNGIYEAIYHGIPMVGIPMFADQPDNIAHMKAKGMAVELDFNTMQTQDLINALNMVINNSSYKENAVRLSEIHHDQPIKPLDRAVFWIEFVMRHKGAKHLRPAAHELTWYQYHCLDVLAFLLVCAVAAVFIAVRCCLFCCKKCGRIVKKKKTE
ncbi:UDP-glucuronosyltransferase 2C1-like isoform X3 [Trachemys scripta elegans]|uniref:UDP-glucuronosyltransferase 2C1-like isoform X3 n=1 Tax=Trachemys scripta elegans TaxID=31138 RepID=UPI001552D4C5|nr:UDP-glucuronosyltransferase 2C1-like isoform X3 [Trachemys scripta elegans]